MLFDSAHTDELKSWLATELEPICDADPEVLSDYVMALLRRDASETELAKSMREQLTDFLEGETDAFVDRVFAALSSKSYLPESLRQPAPVAPTPSIPTGPSSKSSSIPPNPSLPANPSSAYSENSRKRKPEDDARDTSPKISKILTLDESIKAHNLPSHPGSQRNEFHKNENRQGGNIIWGNGEIQLKKGQCIDYHLKGFCSRGDSCQYEHAPNVIPGSNNTASPKPSTTNPFVSSMTGGGIRMGASSPTPASNFSNGLPNTPGSFNPRNGRTASPAGGGMNGESELASRMGPRPRAPHLNPHQHQQQFPFQQSQQPIHMTMGPGGPMHNGMPTQIFPGGGMMPPGGFDLSGGAWRGGMTGANHNSRGGGASNRGRGGAGGGAGQFRNQGQKSDTTLVLENVPQENLDLVQVNEYFKKFGTITNIQIDAPNKKALVSFAKPSQASEAHSNPDVIFGNRFVKCYFQRLDDNSQPFQQQQQRPHQHQQSPQPQSQPSKIPHGAVAPPPKSSFIPGQTSHVYVAPGASTPSSSSTSVATNGGVSLNAEEKRKLIRERDSKQKELEDLLNEQKSLFTKISATTNAEEKKSFMTRLRSLDKETKELKEKIQKAVESVNNFKEAPSISKYQQEEERKRELREQKERERLDRELDLHAQAPKDGSKEEELKETLRKLQAEATSIGLDANGNPTTSNSSRGGRGGFRGGRGGSMRLDNRTTRLSVKGLKKADEGKRDQLKEHFKQFGDVESFEDEPSDEKSEEAPGLIVVYKARPSGEAALRSGNEIPEIGQVQLSWSNTAPISTQNSSSSPSTLNKQDGDQTSGDGDE